MQWPILFLVALGARFGAAANSVESSGNDVNSMLSLLVAVPLTDDGQDVLDPGWYQLAAAQLAVDHFNARDAVVVPELEHMSNCHVTIEDPLLAMDTGKGEIASWFLQQQRASQSSCSDTTTSPSSSPSLLLDDDTNRTTTINNDPLVKIPDAIAGPYHEMPAMELSVIAQGLQIPLVAHRGVEDPWLRGGKDHPFVSQVGADDFSQMDFVGRYLRHQHRTNYIVVLYASTPRVSRRVEILRQRLRQQGIDNVQTFSYQSPLSPTETIGEADDDTIAASVLDALYRAKATGYRTIVLQSASILQEAPYLQNAATQVGLDRGEHMWILSGGQIGEHSTRETLEFLAEQSHENNFLAYMLSLYAYDAYEINPRANVRAILSRQNASFVKRVQNLTPHFRPIELEHHVANEEYPIEALGFSWTQGAGFMYDAVMAIGIGACHAANLSNSTTRSSATTKQWSGSMHVKGIRDAQFSGATGLVQFGNFGNPGSRVASKVAFGVNNIVPDRNRTKGLRIVQSEVLDPALGVFRLVYPAIYADLSSQPPILLRDTPNQNFLSPGVRTTGLVLMAIAMCAVLLSVIWVAYYRNHSVVIAAQPVFLYCLCAGAFVVAFVIWTFSNDESYGWDETALSRSCYAFVWFDSLGKMFVFSTLFTKLWRVNRCLRYKTSQIEVWRFIWPCVLLMLLVIAVLIAWTVAGDYGWVRKEIDPVTGVSIAWCSGPNEYAFLLPIFALQFSPMILAGIISWRSMGIDDLYSEHKWVLTFIMVHIQILCVALPIIAILEDVSTDGRYLGLMLMTWSFPMSSVCLLILPKVVAVSQMQRRCRASEGMDNISPLPERMTSPARAASTTAPASTQRAPGPEVQVVTFE